MSVTERVTTRLARRMDGRRPSRRGFLGGATLVGAALATNPWSYLTRPASAYDAVCGSDNTCAAGYSVFCCTINDGQNTCPPDSFIGGWWKADNSSFCGGSARYYIDCNAYRDNHYTCHCNTTTCDQRLVACNQFRYGQCNTQIPYSDTGPVVCRMVSCTPPWQQFAGVCGTSSATDNNTATHSAPCLTGAPPAVTVQPRIGVLTSDGSFLVKEGGLTAPWSLEATGVRAAAMSGTRIGVLATDGTVYVKDGDLGASWVTEISAVSAIALSGDRIAVLGQDTWLRVKSGSVSAAWADEASTVARMAIDGTRIAFVDTGGGVYVKDGALSAPWAFETDSASDVRLSGTRIGVLHRDGSVYVKDGDLNAAWSLEATGCTALALAGNRLAVRQSNGNLLVKEGALTAGWQLVADRVERFAVTQTRLGVVQTGGTLSVKEGSLGAPWTTESTSAVDVVLT